MDNTCIICLNEDATVGLNDELIRPCNCKSSLVHRSCLDAWRSISSNPNAKDTCTTCKTKYIFEPDPYNKNKFRNTSFLFFDISRQYDIIIQFHSIPCNLFLLLLLLCNSKKLIISSLILSSLDLGTSVFIRNVLNNA